jgi:hypothetical protein
MLVPDIIPRIRIRGLWGVSGLFVGGSDHEHCSPTYGHVDEFCFVLFSYLRSYGEYSDLR